MLEITTNPRVRQGFQNAHKERADAFRYAMRWISGRR